MVISLKFRAKAIHNKIKFKYTKSTKLNFIVILFLKKYTPFYSYKCIYKTIKQLNISLFGTKKKLH